MKHTELFTKVEDKAYEMHKKYFGMDNQFIQYIIGKKTIPVNDLQHTLTFATKIKFGTTFRTGADVSKEILFDIFKNNGTIEIMNDVINKITNLKENEIIYLSIGDGETNVFVLTNEKEVDDFIKKYLTDI